MPLMEPYTARGTVVQFDNFNHDKVALTYYAFPGGYSKRDRFTGLETAENLPVASCFRQWFSSVAEGTFVEHFSRFLNGSLQ